MKAGNNFDLIRLFAATEVAVYHASVLLGVALPPVLRDVVYGLPGVPIFFLLSGFLLTRSLAEHRDPWRYVRDRALRIYPALWVCFGVTVALVLAAGVVDAAFLASDEGRGWIITQMAFGYGAPPPVNEFGLGNPNASLWTIAVELEFYAALGVLLLGVAPRLSRRSTDALLVVLASASFALSVVRADAASRAPNLLDGSLLPHAWVFLLGVLAARHWDAVRRVTVGHPIPWVLQNVVFYAWVLAPQTSERVTAALFLPRFVLLAGLVLSLAYWRPHLATRWLRGDDVSYGVYLYHFVLISCVAQWWPDRTPAQNVMAFCAVLVGTFVCASVSWMFVEEPALRLKLRSANTPRGAKSLQPVAS